MLVLVVGASESIESPMSNQLRALGFITVYVRDLERRANLSGVLSVIVTESSPELATRAVERARSLYPRALCVLRATAGEAFAELRDAGADLLVRSTDDPDIVVRALDGVRVLRQLAGTGAQSS